MPVQTVWYSRLNNLLTCRLRTTGSWVSSRSKAIGSPRTTCSRERSQWIIDARPVKAPVAGGGLVFLVETGALRALHAGDGSIAWELPLADPLAVHPVWDNGWLVVATAAGELRAFRATDGQLIWRRDLKSPAHARPRSPPIASTFPTNDDRDRRAAASRRRTALGARLGGAANDILALDDRLYVGSQDNFFYCVMAADGRVDWRWRTGGDIIGMPVADDRYVYFVALDNVLRAINLISGGQQWMRPLPFRPAGGRRRRARSSSRACHQRCGRST